MKLAAVEKASSTVNWVSKKLTLSISWVKSKLTKKQFIIFSSLLVGVSVGLAAVVLKTFAHSIFELATFYNVRNFQFLFLLFPIAGIFLTVFIIKKFFKGKLAKGLSHIHFSIAKNSGLIEKKQMYAQIVTSSLTIGLGGSAGLEAPIMLTGAAYGSNYGKTYHLNYQERTLLLACGIAAGIGAVFNAPIAGVLCALEILLLDISISAFTPLIIAAATGALTSNIILAEGILISFESRPSFDYHNLPYYIVLGLFAGMVSFYHSHMFLKIEGIFDRSSKSLYQKALIGGCLLAVLLFFFPSLFGEGYASIKSLASERPADLINHSTFGFLKDNQWFLLLFVGAIIFIKAFATGLTLGSGGIGGNFAPSLFVGAYSGYFFSKLVNLLGITTLPISNFTVVGMAGVISGIYHAPLTAIFLIAEVTGGYSLMIPLMVVSSISYTLSKYFEPYPMDTIRMARKGTIITQDKDKKILTNIKAAQLIETEFKKVPSTATLGDLVQLISMSKRNIFPVVDEENKLMGIILLDDIREIIFKADQYETVLVKNLMTAIPSVIKSDETADEIMKKFDETGAWNLPVINDNKEYIGFISKSRVFSSYRNTLQSTTL